MGTQHDAPDGQPAGAADVHALPCASPLFRVLAGMFTLATLVVPYMYAEAWLAGTPLPAWKLGGPMEMFFLAVLSLSFGWVAVTGRMPKRLFKLLTRSA